MEGKVTTDVLELCHLINVHTYLLFLIQCWKSFWLPSTIHNQQSSWAGHSECNIC